MTQRPTIFQSLLIISLFLLVSCNTKDTTANHPSTAITKDGPANFFGKPEEYLDWQAEQILHATELTISKYPPQIEEPFERQLAMLMLDAVFHDVKAPHREPVQAFHVRRTLSALEEIESTSTTAGMHIWKLYDMGVIVRTKSVTVAFDITRGYSSGSESFALPDDIIDRIATQCDALFISHFHQDHADEAVARAFLDQGKPVVTPNNVWEEKPIHNEITHLERIAHEIQNLRLNNKNVDLNVVIYPGHQGADILNNVVLVVTPEGYSVCHTGDQSSRDDFSWINEVKDHFTLDVLIPNCWTTDPLQASQGFNPQLIIPTHENELGHTIDHREAYALNYSRWNVPYDKVIMTWGESYHYE